MCHSLRTVGLIFLFGLLAGACAPGPLRADEPDPEGRWPKYKVGQQARCVIWRDDNVWHIRTTTAHDQKVVFTGVIKVVGGNITGLGHLNLLEGGKGKEPPKVKMEAPAIPKDTLEFKFTTHGKEDGVDFTVSERATEVSFVVKIDGADVPDKIFVGSGGKHPSAAAFRLPNQKAKD